MKSPQLLVAAVLVIMLMSGTVTAFVANSYSIRTSGTVNYPPSQGLSYLHTDGRFIKNEFGEIVYLRGCAKMCMEFVTDPDPGAYNVRESDFENIKNLLRPNVVRIDLALSLLFPTFDTAAPDPTYLGHMDNIVKWCGDRDMYVLFDCHGYYPQMGAPSDFWIPATTGEEGIAEPYRSMIRDFWTFIADRYKGNPTVFGFDLYNEPWNAVPAVDRPYVAEWKIVVEEWIDTIRAVNPKLLFIVENAGRQPWGYADWRWIATSPIERPNVVYSPHFYPQRDDGSWKDWTSIPLPGNTFTNDYAAGSYAVAKANMETFLSALYQEDAGYPLMITEFGLTADESSLQCLRDVLDFFNRHGYSYTYWTWCGRPPGFYLVQEDWVTLYPQGEILAEYLVPTP